MANPQGNQTPIAGVPWSIFTNGGGPGAAATWADDALREIGAPLKTDNEQFIYDWETSEGGGGWYNPLNQGPDPDNPSLTTTGAQYGGGAANYKSYAAGLTGFKDYLNMSNFSDIRDDLKADDPVDARSALIQSDWASSHYGDGSAFSDAALPGKKSALKGTAGVADDIQTTSIISGLKSAASLTTDLTSADFWERAGLVIFGALLILMGLLILSLPMAQKSIQTVGSTARSITAAGNLIGGDSGNSGGPSEEEKADRSRRLSLAEKNTDIGATKAETARMRELRLATGKPKHKGGSEPNPNPPHS
jgi:hypothetical protein